MRGCSALGSMYQKGEDVPQDSARAAELYKKGCKRKDMRSCFHLGELYDTGEGVMQNTTRATELYKKACDGYYILACDNPEERLQTMIEQGKKP